MTSDQGTTNDPPREDDTLHITEDPILIPKVIEAPDDPPTADATTPKVESIWIEGEAATIKQIVPLDWYDNVKKHMLSGGAWAGHFTEKKPGYAAYEFQASNDSDYRFWLRANPVKCELFWRLNEGAWQQIDFSSGLRDKANIAADNKLDIRFIAWKEVGDVRLKRGSNQIEFRMEVKENENLRQHHGAIDCMCLTTDDWEPSGISKPPLR